MPYIPGQILVVQGTAVNNGHRVQNVPQVHQDQYVPGALHVNAILPPRRSPTSVMEPTWMNEAGYAQALPLPPVNQGYPQDMPIQQDVTQGQASVVAVAGTNDAGNSNAQALSMERRGSCLSLSSFVMEETEEELENAHNAFDDEFLKIATKPDEKTTATKPDEKIAAAAAKPDEKIAAAKPDEKKKNNKTSGGRKRNAASGSTKKRQKRQKKEKPPVRDGKITQWTVCKKRCSLERMIGDEFDSTMDFVNHMMVDYGGPRRRIHRGVGAGGSARAATEDSGRYQASTPTEMVAYKWLSDLFPGKFKDISDDEWESEEE